MSVGALLAQNISFSKSIERWDEKKKENEEKAKIEKKMIWVILMADFISGNPVQQGLADEDIPTSYFNSIITTLMQVNIFEKIFWIEIVAI